MKVMMPTQDFSSMTLVVFCQVRDNKSEPSRKLSFECQNIATNLTFFQKIAKYCLFYKKKLTTAGEKKRQFLAILWKNEKFLEIF